MHRVTSSSPSSSSSSSGGSTTSALASSWLLVLRDRGLAEPSTSSEDSDRRATELRGEIVLCVERPLRSARPEEIEEVEELDCCCEEGLGFEVARKDRLDDIMQSRLLTKCNHVQARAMFRCEFCEDTRTLCSELVLGSIEEERAQAVFPRGALELLGYGEPWCVLRQ